MTLYKGSEETCKSNPSFDSVCRPSPDMLSYKRINDTHGWHETVGCMNVILVGSFHFILDLQAAGQRDSIQLAVLVGSMRRIVLLR